MSRRTTKLAKVALSALHYSGADNMIAPFTRGMGAIIMLHQVRPEMPSAAEPGRILKITPEFLEQVIRQARMSGFEVVSLDEAHFRLVEGDRAPFVCFAFDDGYRDTLMHAYPVFQRYELPFAVYVASDHADGRGNLWPRALERVIVQCNGLDARLDGVRRRLRCNTPAEKDAAFRTVYGWLRSIDEDDARAFVDELCANAGIDASSLCGELMMNWEEIRTLSADPLVTIGAHTRRHYALAALTLAEAKAEIEGSVRRIEREIHRPCRHFSYPYGDAESAGPREFELVRELGLKTGVCGRRGLIQAEHREELTALPRIDLNGDYQHARYVKVLLSGAPFALGRLVKGEADAAHIG